MSAPNLGVEAFSYETFTHGVLPGTEDWHVVAELGDQGGYDWCDFNAFYSPTARRYFWHGDSGCSCNSWSDDVNTAADFQNGDRASLLRAWEAFSKEHSYSIDVTEYTHGVTTIKNFEEP